MNYTARQAFHQTNRIHSNIEAVMMVIRSQCSEIIKRYSEMSLHSCNYRVPKFILGFAIFDWVLVRSRLREELKNLEYKVKYSRQCPEVMRISWDHFDIKDFRRREHY